MLGCGPMDAKAASTSRLPARARRPVSTSSAVAVQIEAPLVLIADAEPESRSAREQQLRAAGFRVAVARTGFEAIVKASCHVPDIILIADSIGEDEASETERLLTMCAMTAHIPVIPVTGGRRVPRRVLSGLCRRVT